MAEMDKDAMRKRFQELADALRESTWWTSTTDAMFALVAEQRAEARREAAEECVGLMRSCGPHDTHNDYVTESYFKRAENAIRARIFDGAEIKVALAPAIEEAEKAAAQTCLDIIEDIGLEAGVKHLRECFHLDAREEPA